MRQVGSRGFGPGQPTPNHEEEQIHREPDCGDPQGSRRRHQDRRCVPQARHQPAAPQGQRAKTAERALEEALLARFGTLRSAPKDMLLRHDNGLVFRSRQYRAVVSDYGLKQE